MSDRKVEYRVFPMALVTNNPRKFIPYVEKPVPRWQRVLFYIGFWTVAVGSAVGVSYFIHPLALPVLFWMGWNMGSSR